MPPDAGNNRRIRLDLDTLLHRAQETRLRLEKERRGSMRKRDTSVNIVYKTPLHKISILPNENLRYKWIALGEPEVMPEDIVLFVDMELARIQKESLLKED